MQLMLPERGNAKGRLVLDRGQLAGRAYRVEPKICGNPVCECKEFTLHCSPETPDVAASQTPLTLELDLERRILVKPELADASPVSGLAEAVRDRMAFWSVLAKSQQRPFEVRAPARRVEISLDRGDLDAAIDALLSNVFAHTPEKTPFSIQLRRTAAAAQSWSLIVEDHGPGARAPQALPGSRRGTGLGLDIVRRTAERAGGTAIIGAGKTGGYRVEIRIPDNAASTAGRANPADTTKDGHQS